MICSHRKFQPLRPGRNSRNKTCTTRKCETLAVSLPTRPSKTAKKLLFRIMVYMHLYLLRGCTINVKWSEVKWLIFPGYHIEQNQTIFSSNLIKQLNSILFGHRAKLILKSYLYFIYSNNVKNYDRVPQILKESKTSTKNCSPCFTQPTLVFVGNLRVKSLCYREGLTCKMILCMWCNILNLLTKETFYSVPRSAKLFTLSL